VKCGGVIALLAIVACTKKDPTPYGQYCEGDAVGAQSATYERIDLKPERPDNDPDTVGSARLRTASRPPYAMRRDPKSKTKFVIVDAGVPV
jgi:hypothetical protein